MTGRHAAHERGALGRLYRRFATPIVREQASAWIFLLGVGIATLLSMTLFATKSVTVKLLPFDNKSEIRSSSICREGPASRTPSARCSGGGRASQTLPELTSIQSYAGTPAPFNFNGLVRHYYLRARPEQGELAVNLSRKRDRSRASHAIALDIRKRLTGLASPDGHQRQSGRGAARAAGAGDAARRDLRPRPRDPPRGRRKGAGSFAAVHFVVDVDDFHRRGAARLRAVDPPGPTRVLRGRAGDVYDTIAR